MSKKGLSPVIASILLIALVLVLATIIYLWARAFIPETVEKFGSTIENSCQNIVFDVTYSGGYLRVQNNGNVPIQGIRYAIEEPGSLAYEDLMSPAPIVAGGTSNFVISGDSGGKNVRVVPILLGKASTGELKAFVCDESVKIIAVP